MKRYGVLLVIMQGCSLFCAEEEFEVIESEPLSVSVQELISARVQEVVKLMNATTNYDMWHKGKKSREDKLYVLGLPGEQQLLNVTTHGELSEENLALLKKSLSDMRERVAHSLWSNIRDTIEEPSQKSMFSFIGFTSPAPTLQSYYEKLRGLYENAMKDEVWARKQADEPSFFNNELGPVMKQIGICFVRDIDALRDRFAELYGIRQTKGGAWNLGDTIKKIWNDVLAAVLGEYDERCMKRCFGLLKRLIEIYDGVTIRELWSNIKDRGGISRHIPHSIPWTIDLMKKNPGSSGGISFSGSLESDIQRKFESYEKDLTEAYYKRVPRPQEEKTYAQQEQVAQTSALSDQDQKEFQQYVREFIEKIIIDRSSSSINQAGEALRVQLVGKLTKHKQLCNPGRMVKHRGTVPSNPTAQISKGERFVYPEYDILPPEETQELGKYIGELIKQSIPQDVSNKTRLLIQAQMHPDKLGSIVNFEVDADLSAIFDEIFKKLAK